MAASTLKSREEFTKLNSWRSTVIWAEALAAHSVSAVRDILARRAFLSLWRLNDLMLADLGVERQAIVLPGRQSECVATRAKAESSSLR